ncbi:hypothetical protein DPEC_G00076760 [Dallia pectoralis]|uniref:Uncharacterized protein n=1 Tax=Dallia pectoralis TaxID=75939 RepID=A0ACC2H3Q3_DALPE|nr:hypothetical protein DPEC_G00076760 [Dallia pectoralis]
MCTSHTYQVKATDWCSRNPASAPPEFLFAKRSRQQFPTLEAVSSPVAPIAYWLSWGPSSLAGGPLATATPTPMERRNVIICRRFLVVAKVLFASWAVRRLLQVTGFVQIRTQAVAQSHCGNVFRW